MYNADERAKFYYGHLKIQDLDVFPMVGTNKIAFAGLWETWYLSGNDNWVLK